MAKMKTKKSAKKRFKTTGSGKIMRKGKNLNHLLEKKSSRRKRRLRGKHQVAKSDVKNIQKMISE